LGYRGVDQDNPDGGDHPPGQVQVADKLQQRRLAQASAGGGTGHRAPEVRPPHGSVLVDRGNSGDALHAVLCAAGYNLRWLMRAMVRLGLRALLLRLIWLALLGSIPALRILSSANSSSVDPLSSSLRQGPAASDEFCRGD
jgi:IS5 family transposase